MLAGLMKWAYGTKMFHKPMYNYLSATPFDNRTMEYEQSLKFLDECENVLDVASGTGTFMEQFKKKIVGIDINPDNVKYCRDRGLDVVEGSATALPFPDNSFDGLHCSHLLQVFTPDMAAQFMREAGRVVKNDGVVVISALNWFPRFFRHPENVRPYPPDAIHRLCQVQGGATSPMYPGIPNFHQVDIWFRRPPLFEFVGFTPEEDMWLWRLNPMQQKRGIVKFWTFDSYIMKLRIKKDEAPKDEAAAA